MEYKNNTKLFKYPQYSQKNDHYDYYNSYTCIHNRTFTVEPKYADNKKK